MRFFWKVLLSVTARPILRAEAFLRPKGLLRAQVPLALMLWCLTERRLEEKLVWGRVLFSERNRRHEETEEDEGGDTNNAIARSSRKRLLATEGKPRREHYTEKKK
jgi:hypothetical protein